MEIQNWFKHGMEVTCIIDGEHIDDAKLQYYQNNYWYICQNETGDGFGLDNLGYKYCVWVRSSSYNIKDLQPKVDGTLLVDKVNKNLNIKNNMNLIQKFREAMTTEPEKTFKKLGVIDERNDLTDEGTELFLNWLFEKNKETFKTEICDKMLEGVNKQNKNKYEK